MTLSVVAVLAVPLPAGAAPDPCPPVADCESASAPNTGSTRRFRHRRSAFVSAIGQPNHRGRDLLLRPGDPQLVIAKFAYGLTDKDLVDEEVDVWLLRGCGGSWQRLGTAITSDDGDHAEVEGVRDTGGRIYFQIPAARRLAAGRHRIHLSVAGDRSGTDLVIHVAPAGTPVFISDVDGTLTGSESAELGALVAGVLPAAHPSSPAALRALAARGHIPIYLSARPEPLVGRTRAFLARNGFPPGLVQTTTRKTGALGRAAARFKTAAIARSVNHRGYIPTFAFGNTASDAQTYAHVQAQQRLLYRFTDRIHGSRRFDAYGPLIPELQAARSSCAAP
ncbi:MAG TPA: hypothetical protein VNO33_11435 [Kofleriaceae bacterium]|nr:hypothetical protein [Kofleriaceae bacterium]